jgi:hypothetical protein
MASSIDSHLTLALDNQTRSLLGELDKRMQAIDSKWESSVGALESQVAKSAIDLESVAADFHANMVSHHIAVDATVVSRIRLLEADTSNRVMALEFVVQVLDLWHPHVDSSIAALHTSVDVVHADGASATIHGALTWPLGGQGAPGILGAPGFVTGHPPAPHGHADGSNFEHNFVHNHRDSGFGYSNPNFHCPVTGMWSPSSSPSSFSFAPQLDSSQHGMLHCQLGGLPKLNFPSFDGTNPKSWQTKCEKYFDMYATDPVMWVKVSTMHFEGVASRWLQSVEPCLSSMSWRQFCQCVQERFGREQHEIVIH